MHNLSTDLSMEMMTKSVDNHFTHGTTDGQDPSVIYALAIKEMNITDGKAYQLV